MTNVQLSNESGKRPAPAWVDTFSDFLNGLTMLSAKTTYRLDDLVITGNGDYSCIFYDEQNPNRYFSTVISKAEFIAFLKEERANEWDVHNVVDGQIVVTQGRVMMDDLLNDPCFEKRDYLELFVNRGRDACNC